MFKRSHPTTGPRQCGQLSFLNSTNHRCKQEPHTGNPRQGNRTYRPTRALQMMHSRHRRRPRHSSVSSGSSSASENTSLRSGLSLLDWVRSGEGAGGGGGGGCAAGRCDGCAQTRPLLLPRLWRPLPREPCRPRPERPLPDDGLKFWKMVKFEDYLTNILSRIFKFIKSKCSQK